MMDKLEKAKQKGDLISRKALKEHKFVGNKYVQIGGRTNGKTLGNIIKAYQQGWNDCIDAIIDNAPTVDPPEWQFEFVKMLYEKARPKGEWIKVTQRISDSVTTTYWECSICREPDRKEGESKFCCECGAKMKKSQTQKFADTDTGFDGLASAT